MHYLFAPQYKGLSTEVILGKLKDWPAVEAYLPDEIDRPKLPRQFLINIFNTVVGEPFGKWVQKVINARNEHLAIKNDLLINLDPDVARCF